MSLNLTGNRQTAISQEPGVTEGVAPFRWGGHLSDMVMRNDRRAALRKGRRHGATKLKKRELAHPVPATLLIIIFLSQLKIHVSVKQVLLPPLCVPWPEIPSRE